MYLLRLFDHNDDDNDYDDNDYDDNDYDDNDDVASPWQHKGQVLSQSGQGNFGQSTIAPHPDQDDDDDGVDDDNNEYTIWLFFPYADA